MQTQLKTIRGKSKGRRSSKASKATDERQFLMEFNAGINQAAAKAMEHLTHFVFITMGNFTLAHRDAYLNHMKNGIKPDMLAALRTAPLHISTLFPDAVIKRAEEEIAYYDNKGQSTSSSSRIRGWYHPYERSEKRSEGRSETKQERHVWKNIGRWQFRGGMGKDSNFSSRPAKGQQSYKWQSLYRQVSTMTAGWEYFLRTDNDQFSRSNFKLKCCQSCTFCTLAFPKERSKSWSVIWKITKYVKSVFMSFNCLV